ncbi:MAG: 3-hydroxyacyl-CoA dehydrogenase NAD-binding domain-containing protein [Steroidobacteraceae bacterium]
MTNVAPWTVEADIGILTIDSPPVNALGAAVRKALHDGLESLLRDDIVRMIVLLCGGKTFFAGADITEFGRPIASPTLRELVTLADQSSKPIVAAIHGTALGGGLELALACQYRIAVPSARIGLPEVTLGLLPGAGGTQRLPRMIGAEAALDLMVTGRMVSAAEAQKLGIIDALVTEGQLREKALVFARDRVTAGSPPKRLAAGFPGTPDTSVFDRFRSRNAKLFRGFKAPEAIVQAVRAAQELPFQAGMDRELELFFELERSAESRAQRYAFFAERQTARVPDISADTREYPITEVGVIGAGTMGGGITTNFLNAGIPVMLVESTRGALERGLAVIRRNYESSAKKGKITAEQIEQRMGLIKPGLDLDRLRGSDLIIEAVYEEMQVKKSIFSRLDGVAKKGAILASNTSFLNLNEIASATSRPEFVVGLHFFSPANVMRLVEVVRGRMTSSEVIATSMRLAKRIGKVPVLSGVCHGFIANRLMEQRQKQANALLLQGVSPTQIDDVLTDYGFAMGEFQMMDLVGLDVIGRESTELTVAGELVRMGRLGQKAGHGYYDYDEARTPRPSPITEEIIRSVARRRGIQQRKVPDPSVILARLLYPVVNEGAKVLDEGIALRACDADIAMILGYNWPVYTGGPMFWGDAIGLARVVSNLKEMEAEYGDAFRPSPLLERLAAQAKTFTT